MSFNVSHIGSYINSCKHEKSIFILTKLCVSSYLVTFRTLYTTRLNLMICILSLYISSEQGLQNLQTGEKNYLKNYHLIAGLYLVDRQVGGCFIFQPALWCCTLQMLVEILFFFVFIMFLEGLYASTKIDESNVKKGFTPQK